MLFRSLLDSASNTLLKQEDQFSNVSLTLNIEEHKRKSTFHQFINDTHRKLYEKEKPNKIISHDYSPNISQCSCPRVIIVDDMDHIHIVMKRQLIKLGISAYDCYSGEELIDFLNDYSLPSCCKGFQIIFLDMHMEPGMTGIEIANILKEKMSQDKIPKITIIGLSADLIEQSVMDEIEIKPLTQEKLQGFIARYVR